MHAAYADITRRISDAPQWWDSNGVPRYDTFKPDDVPSIYASQVVLYEIACQECGRRFRVADEWSPADDVLRGRNSLDAAVEHRVLHYGDPPRHGDGECSAGDTMNSIPLKVLEFWQQTTACEWERRQQLEVSLED